MWKGRGDVLLACKSALSCKYRQCQVRSYSAPTDGIPPAKQKFVPTSGTYPVGFHAGSAHVGIKTSNTRFDDLAIIASKIPCPAVAVFTRNKFLAAPVTVSKQILKSNSGHGIQGVIVNSGCANAVTGTGGIEDALKMSREVDRCLGDNIIDKSFVQFSQPRSLVMSTGVIGQRLPISKILANIPAAVSTMGSGHSNWLRAARAICTTDTFPKLVSRSFTLPSYPNTTFSLAGMTKGAGMIHPNMATLLGIICTDAPVSPLVLPRLLSYAVDKSFNCISIDGDGSTNDSVCLLANGAAVYKKVSASNKLIGNPKSADFNILLEELTALTTSLAQMIVRDGEGATKFVTIRVLGAKNRNVGRHVASTIARSPLVKTALYGKDANFGRILMAIGNTPAVRPTDIVPEKVSVSFVPVERDGTGSKRVRVNVQPGSVHGELANRSESNSSDSGNDVDKSGSTGDATRETPTDELKLVVNGEAQTVDEARAARILENEDLEILVKLNGEERGAEVVYWTCDLSHEYVTINGDYRT